MLHRAEPGGHDRGAVSFGGGRLRIDEARHQATLDGQPLELTPTEWGLLAALAAAPGRVFSRYELVNRVRGYEFDGYERTIDSHVKNLRHKLGTGGSRVVETVLGVGYRLGLSRDRWPGARLVIQDASGATVASSMGGGHMPGMGGGPEQGMGGGLADRGGVSWPVVVDGRTVGRCGWALARPRDRPGEGSRGRGSCSPPLRRS